MKPRYVILGLLAVAIVFIAFLAFRSGGAQREVEATRQLLRQQGFKTDLSEFNFSTSPQTRNRLAPLDISSVVRPMMMRDTLDLLPPVGSDTAITIWQQNELPVGSLGPLRGARLYSPSGIPTDFGSPDAGSGWSALRESLDDNRDSLDAAASAALSGPIQFDLQASAGMAMMLRHLAGLRTFSQNFGSRAVLELHEDHKNLAWTNLLAATRLVTAWEPEPSEISHLVRDQCCLTTFKTTWQMLQSHGWDDARLADLQREWEGVDFFKNLPETAAFSRASMAAICQQERKQPAASSPTVRQITGSPRFAWAILVNEWSQFRYRHRGTYEDEKAVLLYYRDRELQLRQAIQSANWMEMRQLPGVTNITPFQSKYPSRMLAMSNVRQISLRSQLRGGGLMASAAQSEAVRRVIVCAIALERFHARHSKYPKTLAELSPELLQKIPLDFMDGQPLRYHPTDDGHYLLYSVGLDCVDDGGEFAPFSGGRRNGLARGMIGMTPLVARGAMMEGADIVWPRPASAAEVKTQQDEQKRQQDELRAAQEAEVRRQEEAAEARRQSRIQDLLAEAEKGDPSSSQTNEPFLEGKLLRQLLRNEKILGTNQPAWRELLTLKQIPTPEQTGEVRFELPLNYNLVTNLGELGLVVDGQADDDPSNFTAGDEQSCERATNGNCILVWNTAFDAPGQHVIRAQFVLNQPQPTPVARTQPRGGPILSDDSETKPIMVAGPLFPFTSSNLCQFISANNTFDPTAGMNLFAKLVENTGDYSVEIQTTNGEHLRTLTGHTTNGIINVHWNLTDEHDRKCTNESYESIFDITLPKSGRHQKLK